MIDGSFALIVDVMLLRNGVTEEGVNIPRQRENRKTKCAGKERRSRK